ncbi:aminodeoxychorismate/anthranilate synthase component II [Bowdeniella nasicola]|uniref:Aminodeoxychorismate/anthranilate synthase component II n=1 Tax=Bowdeniella nasicola TaxID=208480 RepID=A0A1Q5Q3G3_9ACTO|nr:aminodeoxychorismate/anthranilate synthase component II [Bowdeniella nasicola]OKL54337.1 aminodeoxychorismate/anthranilate synthase component II [Bowdeniella nasicola]
MTVRIRMIDNFDSFVHTITSYLRQLGADVEVVRADIAPTDPRDVDGVVVSPGPGTPSDAGHSIAAIKACATHRVPMLGVCLGHQALGEAFGARVTHAPELMHGKADTVTHDGTGLFAGLPSPLTVARYHSLAIDAASVPAELRVTGTSPTGTVMAIEHRELPLYGVQFHPESILTEFGAELLKNWLNLAR